MGHLMRDMDFTSGEIAATSLVVKNPSFLKERGASDNQVEIFVNPREKAEELVDIAIHELTHLHDRNRGKLSKTRQLAYYLPFILSGFALATLGFPGYKEFSARGLALAPKVSARPIGIARTIGIPKRKQRHLTRAPIRPRRIRLQPHVATL